MRSETVEDPKDTHPGKDRPRPHRDPINSNCLCSVVLRVIHGKAKEDTDPAKYRETFEDAHGERGYFATSLIQLL